MSTKWKSLTVELDDISCSQSGKVELENSTIIHVYEVAKVNWRTLFHVHEVEKFDWRALRYFMSTKWKSITG